MADKICVQATISGRVQGVFFRMETKKTAISHNVSGWVKNLPDGSVAAVFEGGRQDVEAVIQWCWQGPPAAKVDKVDAVEKDYTGAYDDFEVRY